jgi:hypothetical protein
MNDKIKELALQANLQDGWFCGQGNIEKFAELIVKECAGVADHSNVTGKSIIGQRIKEHFGVEE